MNQQRFSAKQRREQIAEAALRILSLRGARALSAKAIAAEVGISDGAVFRHFKNKKAIFEAALARFESYLPAPTPVKGAPVKSLEMFFVERARAVRAHPEILGLAFNDRLQEVLGYEDIERIRAQTQAAFAFILQHVMGAQELGLLPKNFDSKVVAQMIAGALRGAVRGKEPPEKAWEAVWQILFATQPE